MDLQVHDWVVYELGTLRHRYSVPWDQKVKIHKTIPPTGKERGDIEIKDYVVFQNPQSQFRQSPPSSSSFILLHEDLSPSDTINKLKSGLCVRETVFYERIYGITYHISSSSYYSEDMHTKYTLTIP